MNLLECLLDENDPVILDTLIGQFEPQLLALICSRIDHVLVGRIRPEDILQDVWVNSVEQWAGLLPASPASIRGWLLQRSWIACWPGAVISWL
jgi:hypothetical protein